MALLRHRLLSMANRGWKRNAQSITIKETDVIVSIFSVLILLPAYQMYGTVNVADAGKYTGGQHNENVAEWM